MAATRAAGGIVLACLSLVSLAQSVDGPQPPQPASAPQAPQAPPKQGDADWVVTTPSPAQAPAPAPAQQAAPQAVAAPPPATPVPHPAFLVPEPASGLPAGRLWSLPVMSPDQLQELVADLARHIELTGAYTRIDLGKNASVPAFPKAVESPTMLVRDNAGERSVIRLGYVLLPRRLPHLWEQAYVVRDNKIAPNPEGDPGTLDLAVKVILAERSRLLSKLRINDLASRTIRLSYVDADAALFALRAMGYAAVTDSESMPREESYKGEDVDSYEIARLGAAADQQVLQQQLQIQIQLQQQASGAGPASMQGLPPEEQRRFLPKFPAIKYLPTTIALDRLPLVVKMPSTDVRNLGLVGGDLSQAQREQGMGLTIMPSAANPLAETVAGGTAELLVLYHPSYPQQFARLKKIIDETIDKPARQVYIEGLVLEISKEGLDELGVEWQMKKGNWTFNIGSLIPVPSGAAAFGFIRDQSNVTPTQITAKIAALVHSNKAEILSRPSVITLDNRQATIRVGTDIPVATSKDASSVVTGGSNRVAFSFQYIPTGILLNVRPRVSEDLSEISLLVDATVSATVPGQDLQVLDPTTKISLASAPTISTRRVQTYARILNNQPLIIGGLLSRNQIRATDRVPVLGKLPLIGPLFGHTSVQDDKREVIIVLTPSIVTENVRETKAQYPKDDDRFDQFETTLFKEHYRIRAEDLVDSSDFRFNARFRLYRDAANKLIERSPALANRGPFSLFAGNRIPGEFIFVTGMMYRMLDRLNVADSIRVENLKFFEGAAGGQRPVSIAEVMARHGDGVHPASFFERNRGKALALVFTLGRASLAAEDVFRETAPEIRLVECADRETWRQALWDLSQADARGIPRYAILIHDESDLRRLQIAYATQNTVLNNGGVGAMVFDHFLVGQVLRLQEVSPTWERLVNAQIAQYFFIGEHYYMAFIQAHQAAMRSLDAALRSEEFTPLLEGAALPP